MDNICLYYILTHTLLQCSPYIKLQRFQKSGAIMHNDAITQIKLSKNSSLRKSKQYAKH